MAKNRQKKGRPAQQVRWSPDEVRAIVREGDYATLVAVAERLGPALKQNDLSTSQIRNVFGEVRRLQSRYDPNRLHMLRPRLAYMAARSPSQGGKILRDVLTRAILEVFEGQPAEGEQRERFERLVDFFEAILAYHKAAGGK